MNFTHPHGRLDLVAALDDERRDYGWLARIGVAVPHANPTVEPELRTLMPEGVEVHATRLWHPSTRVEERLAHYLRHIPEAHATFGPLRLAALGFGCTASSYLAGIEVEDGLLAAAQLRAGLPVVTAAQSLRRGLAVLGIRTFALVSPYPADLAEAGCRYWREAGFTVAGMLRVDPALSDTHAIYELTSSDALAAVRRLDASQAEAIVLAGTGMPTLRVLEAVRAEYGLPVLSSNLCLAWALLVEALGDRAPVTPLDLLRKQ